MISLARVAGLSHATIAAETGRGEGAVSMLLHHALAQLVARIEGDRDPM